MDHLAALEPLDEHNRKLQSYVHPIDWENPTPSGRYNLVVIGGGPAGLVAAAGAAGLGAKVALIERGLLGGDCLNVGCVPSKGVISSANVAAAVRDASEFGVNVDGGFSVDFSAAMYRMRKLRAGMSHHDSARRFTELGIDVFIGHGEFNGKSQIHVEGQTLDFKKAVIATGARASRLPIPGIDDVVPLTNETVFSLTALPSRLTVIGGGPIGVELAQSFARFGAKVTLVEKSDHILSREESEAAAVVRASMQKDGVEFVFNSDVVSMRRDGDEKNRRSKII